MARVSIGVTCAEGHFNEIGMLWEPIEDKDIDKLAERAMMPMACEVAKRRGARKCGARLVGLPHIQGRERETEQLARVGGRNVHKGLEQKGPKPRKRGPLTDAQLRQVVFDRQRERPGGPARCAVTGRALSWIHDDCHHVLDKRLLHARGEDHVANDDRNAIFIKADIHGGHTSGLARITRDKIPAEAWAYAHERGPWAVQRLEADYPPPE